MDKTPPSDTVAETDVHRAVSDDGTEIAGRVHGTGPPLVLVPGAMSDGEFVWDPLLPELTDQFTCYTMSPRSRGLSGQSADLSRERRLQDVTAFVESIGEPVALFGWSQGGALALGASQETDAVAAVAAYEPSVLEVVGDDEFAQLMATFEHMGELVAADRQVDAARSFIELVATDDELAEAEALGFVERCGSNVPVFLQEMQQLDESEGPSPTEQSELATITVPVLLLHGSRSIPDPWFVDGVRHVAEHVPDSHVHEISGAGHMGPGTEPIAVADALGEFLAEIPEPV